MPTGPTPFKNDTLTEAIIGAAIEVHRFLGPGLLESPYEECLCYELAELDLRVERQPFLPIVYKNLVISRAFRPDLIIEDAVVVEVKAIEKILPIHEAQVLTYLRLTGLKRGVVFNFNTILLKNGIRRLNESRTFPLSPIPPSPSSPPSPVNKPEQE
jgi:GxxExxY protein